MYSKETLRLILAISLALVSMMLWEAWQRDYGVRQQVSSNQGDQHDTVPQESVSEDLPMLPSTPLLDEPIASVSSLITQQYITVKTDLYRITIDKKGGGISTVDLLAYPVSQEQPDQPVRLMDNRLPLFYIVHGGLISKQVAPTHEDIFNSVADSYQLQDNQDRIQVVLNWYSSDSGIQVTKTYYFSRDKYLVDIKYEIHNQTADMWTGHAYTQLQRSNPGRVSKVLYTYTGAVISSPQERYQKISFSDMEEEKLDQDITNGWAAMLQHYFIGALIPPDPEKSYHYYTLVPSDNRYLIGTITPAITIVAGDTGTLQQKLYLGPKEQHRLERIADGLELTVDYGILWFLAQPLFWCLEKFYGITGNWGWAIVMITLMIKIVFFKLSEIGYRSMAQMRHVQPRLIALKNRYKDDRMRLNQAMMDFYKKEKINPFGGCLPIIIQIPVFIALYWMLLESVELRQSAFIFWITDLSSPDRYYVLPILMGATMVIQQKLSPMSMDPIQKKIMTILPIVFTVFFAFFPAGLVLYWVVNNVLSIAQQWVITKKIEQAS